jgi:hypothetical protein
MLWARGVARPLVPDFAASADPSVSFDGTRILFAAKRTKTDRWSIWEIAAAGGRPRPVTTGDGDCFRPIYLPLQKLAYARRTAAGTHIEVAPLAGGRASRLTFAPGTFMPAAVLRDGRILFEAGDLFTVYTDGSGVESYRCDHGPVRFAAAQLSSGDIVFQTAKGLARFTSARSVQLDVAMPAGEFAGPVAEWAGRWLAACRTAADSRGLCSVSPDSSQPATVIVKGNAWQPAPIVPRPVPPYHPSSLGEGAGARLLSLNAYDSKSGPLAPGSIAKVRLWSLDAAERAIALGESPVEADGSFFVQVPGDRPLRWELLDRTGRSLRAGNRWFWTRNGEQRVCVGCHTGPERAPDNIAPRVLDRTQTAQPIGMGGAK